MAERPQEILICSCRDTMPIDVESVGHGCPGARVTTAHELCRAELSKFRTAVSAGRSLIVGCTQEQPLFSEIAGSHDGGVRVVPVSAARKLN